MKLLLCTVLLVGAIAFPATAEESEATMDFPPPEPEGKATLADRERLFEMLFKDYDKKLNPDQPDFKMALTLINFNVSVEENILETVVFAQQSWTDGRLAWNKEDFSGVSRLRIPHEDVWSPDVTLWNTPDQEHRMRCMESNVIIFNSGMVMYVPACDLVSDCEFNVTSGGKLDGEQTCSLKFGSWTYDGWTMDESIFGNATKIDLNSLMKNPKYEIVSTSTERNEKFYDCCEEPYLNLRFNLTIKATN